MRLQNRFAGRFSSSFFVALILLVVLLRLVPVLTNKLLDADELTSYLVATGHKGEYLERTHDGTLPVLEWVPALEWQRYLQIEDGSTLLNVMDDLLIYDIHPPAYFLLLRGWTRLLGNIYWSGMLLSWLLDIACFGLLILAGKSIFFKETSAGWLSGLIWIVSPVAIFGGALTRQYSLLTFFTILFILLLSQLINIRRSSSKRWRITLALLAVAAAGMLTHSLFLFILFAAPLAVVARDPNSPHARILILLLAAVIGALTLSLSLPPLVSLRIFLLQQITTNGFTIDRTLTFALRSLPLLAPLSIPLIVYITTAFLARVRQKPLALVWNEETRAALRFTLVLFLVPYLSYGALYVSGLISDHAILSRHLLFLTPLVALLATAGLQTVPRTTPGIVALGGLLLCFVLVSVLKTGLDTNARRTLSLTELSNYDHLVIDSVIRPEFFSFMQPESSVFAAGQDALLAQPEGWLPRLTTEGGVYVSMYSSGPLATNDAERRDKILDMIDQSGNYRLIGKALEHGSTVSVYEVTR